MRQIWCLIFIGQFHMALLAMDEQYFVYQSTGEFPDVLLKLEKDPHPWAVSFYRYLVETERQNKSDIARLIKANNEYELSCGPEAFNEKFQDLLTKEEVGSALLLGKFKEFYKPERNWSLYSSLGKMVGTPQEHGIYHDSKIFAETHPDLYENSADAVVKLWHGNQLTVAKNAYIHALVLKADNGNVIPDLVTQLAIIQPNSVPANLCEYAKNLCTFDDCRSRLHKASVSYEFGANPKDTKKNIWDCSSLISLVMNSTLRLSTIDFQYAYNYARGDSYLDDNAKYILTEVDVLDLSTTELKFMDIIVWRSKSGGHMGFYLGALDNGYVVIGNASRSDDKSEEGTGIIKAKLYKENQITYAFRKKEWNF